MTFRHLCLLIFSMVLLYGEASRAQVIRSETFSVDSSRPVATALLELTNRHPGILTYEDPPYAYSGDIQDATLQVRGRQAQGAEGRVLVPQGGRIFGQYDVYVGTGRIVDGRRVVERIVQFNNRNDLGGHFRLIGGPEALHVVPLEARDANGEWNALGSILDVNISISTGVMEGGALLHEILKETAAVSGTNIFGASYERFNNAFARFEGEIDVKDTPARDVLKSLLQEISERFTWHLNFDPGGQYYIFAVHSAAEPPLGN